jgi:ribosomal RNA-processing protein 9
LWSLNDLAYIETLFGHQDAIPAVASFTSERCISVGARDRSARLWKIVDETQLVFQTSGDSSAVLKEKIRSSTAGEHTTTQSFPEGSTDCVAVIDEQHFVTGSDNGDIILWALNKKKPQYTKRFAHGVDEPLSPGQVSAETYPSETGIPAQPRWITCLASLPYTDLFFSGSWDGKVGMWKISADLRKFELVQYIDTGIKGVINGISVEEAGRRGTDGVRILLAIGSECRLGRWKTVKGGRNCAAIHTLGYS